MANLDLGELKTESEAGEEEAINLHNALGASSGDVGCYKRERCAYKMVPLRVLPFTVSEQLAWAYSSSIYTSRRLQCHIMTHRLCIRDALIHQEYLQSTEITLRLDGSSS